MAATPLTHINARAKLPAALLLAGQAMLLPWNSIALWVVMSVIAGGVLLSSGRLLRLTAPLVALAWMFVLTVLIHGFTTSGHVLWHVPRVGWTLTYEGLLHGGVIVLRLAAAVLITGVVAVTTEALDAIRATESLARPLRKLGINTTAPALVLTLALRFAPVLYTEAQTLQRAASTRGWGRGKGRIGRVLAWTPILAPLIAGSLRRADELADALVLRGYDPTVRRTSLHPTRWRVGDTLVVFVAVLPLAAYGIG